MGLKHTYVIEIRNTKTNRVRYYSGYTTRHAVLEMSRAKRFYHAELKEAESIAVFYNNNVKSDKVYSVREFGSNGGVFKRDGQKYIIRVILNNSKDLMYFVDEEELLTAKIAEAKIFIPTISNQRQIRDMLKRLNSNRYGYTCELVEHYPLDIDSLI